MPGAAPRAGGGDTTKSLAYGREIEVRYVHHAQNIVHSELVLRVGQLHGRHQVAHGGHDGLKTSEQSSQGDGTA